MAVTSNQLSRGLAVSVPGEEAPDNQLAQQNKYISHSAGEYTHSLYTVCWENKTLQSR